MSNNLDEKIMDKLTENIVGLNNRVGSQRSGHSPADIENLSQALLNLIKARKELEYIDNS